MLEYSSDEIGQTPLARVISAEATLGRNGKYAHLKAVNRERAAAISYVTTKILTYDTKTRDTHTRAPTLQLLLKCCQPRVFHFSMEKLIMETFSLLMKVNR